MELKIKRKLDSHTFAEWVPLAKYKIWSVTYDGDGNVASLVTVTSSGEVLVDYNYAYDLNGNRLQKVSSIWEFVFFATSCETLFGMNNILLFSKTKLKIFWRVWIDMAKAGMRRQDPSEPHGTESNHKQHYKKNDVKNVPQEIQGKAKTGNAKAGSII